MDCGFRLSHTHRFHENAIEAGCFTKDDGLTCFSGDTTQGARRSRGTDKRIGVVGQVFHTCFIAQDASLAVGRTGVDGQNGHFMSGSSQILTQGLYKGAFPDAGHAGDPHARGISGMWQTSADDLLCQLLMPGQRTFYKGNGFAEQGAVPGEDALYIISGSNILWPDITETLGSIFVYLRWLRDTFMYMKRRFVFFSH